MSTTSGGRHERRVSDVRPEYILLGFLIEEPAHGYELYRRFNDSLAGLWHISESQMYATLKRLEDRAMLSGAPLEKGLAASRRVLKPTEAGRNLFESWLVEPSACSPRVLRLEFLSRLYFARRMVPASLPRLFEAQRAAVLESLGKLPTNRKTAINGFEVHDLALGFSEGQLRAALQWLDTRVKPVLTT